MASLRFVRPLRSRTVTPLGVALLALACACATGPAPARDDGDAATDGDEPIETDVDIAVVGAGLSGLRAAQHLSAAGFEVVVLEARDRVGGRTLSVPMAAGAVAEAGGQWIGPTQTAVLGLAEELGVATFADHNQGDTVLVFGGMRFTQAGGQPPSPATQAAFAAIDSEASEVPLESPWLAPEASARDAITVADWLAEAGLDAETRETLELGVQSIMGTTTERVSWLYFLFYVHSAGSVNDLFESAQSLRLHGGAHSLSLRLADQLGAALWTSEPVARIVDHGSHVELQHPSGPTTAKRVVLAMSPQAADAIEFEPRLPRERERLQRRWVAEPGAKAHLVYATPFWRDAGLSGEAFGDLPGVALTHDNSGPEANNPGEGPGVLLASSSTSCPATPTPAAKP